MAVTKRIVTNPGNALYDDTIVEKILAIDSKNTVYSVKLDASDDRASQIRVLPVQFTDDKIPDGYSEVVEYTKYKMAEGYADTESCSYIRSVPCYGVARKADGQILMFNPGFDGLIHPRKINVPVGRGVVYILGQETVESRANAVKVLAPWYTKQSGYYKKMATVYSARQETLESVGNYMELLR